MIIYVPVFRNNKHDMQEIDTNKARLIGRTSIMYYGGIYCGDNIYTDPKAVGLYWSKEYYHASKYKTSWFDAVNDNGGIK